MPNYLSQQKSLVLQLEDSFNSKNYQSTVVEMRSDYENDKQICLTSVVFLPDYITQEIVNRVSRTLKSVEPSQYFYQADAMHLTIKNIRTIHDPPLFNDDDIEKVKHVFQEVIPKFISFEFSVEDLILFPTSISIMAYASVELQKLVISLDKALQDVGVPDNKKYLSNSVFWGNITLCRFTKEPSEKLIKAVSAMRTIKIGSFNAEEVSLITCNSVCNPATRKILEEYKLSTV